jgi:predicted DNA-binding protein (UPF0251 family)
MTDEQKKPRLIDLTQREAECLAFCQMWSNRSEVAPTYQEIGDAMGIHRSGVHRCLHSLKRKGRIALHHGNRGIQVLVPIVKKDIKQKPARMALAAALRKAAHRLEEAA